MADPVTSQVPSTSLIPPSPPNGSMGEPLQSSIMPQTQESTITSLSEGSKVSIALLLVSGRRRTQEFDPKTTIGELKETVWGNWPSDWADEKPPSSAFLRILYLGRILTDDTALSSLNLAAPPESTVFHISVRSFAPPSDEDDALKKKQRKRGSRRSRANTRDGSGTDGGNGVDTGAPTGTNTQGDRESRTGCCGCVIC